MLRALLCISCCSVPPPRKRRSSSNLQMKGDEIFKQNITTENKVETEVVSRQISTLSTEKNELLSNVKQDCNKYGTNCYDEDLQGKSRIPFKATAKQASNYDFKIQENNSTSTLTTIKLDHVHNNHLDRGLQMENSKLAKVQEGNLSLSLEKSIEIGPFTGSYSTLYPTQKSDLRTCSMNDGKLQIEDEYQGYSLISYVDEEDSASTNQLYDPLISASTSKNIPSTTKIGDYARIEYSPVEDLDSITTVSCSRLGSEKGGSLSMSKQNSTKATINDGGASSRSSQGGVESTSISISSQLSTEQFHQNLSSILDSVNSNYPAIDMIGLPLGPSLDGLLTDTTKTSPETPGAALTAASQDSLLEAFEDTIPLMETTKSNISSGAALIVDSFDRHNSDEVGIDPDLVAPLAGAEDYGELHNPTKHLFASTMNSKRVESLQSLTTKTSGGLNPTPTPSEMSGSSTKKKRLGAKTLLKKLRPSSRKKSKNDLG